MGIGNENKDERVPIPQVGNDSIRETDIWTNKYVTKYAKHKGDSGVTDSSREYGK